MNDQTKSILERIIISMQEDMSLYSSYPRVHLRDRGRFTVLGLIDLASNHLFDDEPEKFGLIGLEGDTIRHYFQHPDSGLYTYSREYQRAIGDMLKDIYSTFPGIFEGESIEWSKEIIGLENIPMFSSDG